MWIQSQIPILRILYIAYCLLLAFSFHHLPLPKLSTKIINISDWPQRQGKVLLLQQKLHLCVVLGMQRRHGDSKGCTQVLIADTNTVWCNKWNCEMCSQHLTDLLSLPLCRNADADQSPRYIMSTPRPYQRNGSHVSIVSCMCCIVQTAFRYQTWKSKDTMLQMKSDRWALTKIRYQ